MKSGFPGKLPLRQKTVKFFKFWRYSHGIQQPEPESAESEQEPEQSEQDQPAEPAESEPEPEPEQPELQKLQVSFAVLRQTQKGRFQNGSVLFARHFSCLSAQFMLY